MPWGRLLSGVLYNPLKYQLSVAVHPNVDPLPQKTRRSFLKASIPLEKGDKCRNSRNARSACVFVPLGKGDHRGYATNLVACNGRIGTILSLGADRSHWEFV